MNRKTHHILAWIIWVLSASFMFYKYAIEVSPSVMTSHLMKEFHIDGVQLGNLAACYFYAYLLMQIPAGLLVDHFGPRRVTSIAILICGLGTLLFASSSNLFLAQLGRFAAGFGAAFAALNCLKLTANWFASNRFALMAGLMMTLGMLGAVFGQSPLSWLIGQLGWRDALYAIAIAGLILGLLFYVIVRDQSRYTPFANAQLTPEGTSLWESCKAVFKSKQSWLLSIYSGLAFAPITAFGGLWGVPFISEAYQLDKIQAANIMSFIFIGFAIGAPVWGWFSDYIGTRRKVMMIGVAFSLVAFCIMLYVPISLTALTITHFLFGFFLSSFLICFTMIREINAPAVAATAIGFMNAFDAFMGAISDPLMGKFLDMGWMGKVVDGVRIYSVQTYQIALSAIPVYLLVAFGLLFLIRETYCKSIYPSAMP